MMSSKELQAEMAEMDEDAKAVIFLTTLQISLCRFLIPLCCAVCRKPRRFWQRKLLHCTYGPSNLAKRIITCEHPFANG